MDVWEYVLKKNVKSNHLQKAKTVPQAEIPYDVQIFEMLVAESLNLQDQHTNWEVTRASHDQGIDLLGTDTVPCRTPFATTQYQMLSVGQVKRRKNSYKYEDFRTDIRKARRFWVNSNLFCGNAPKQFLFVLSTDGKNGVRVLQEHLEQDLSNNLDAQFKSDQLTHIQLIDASVIIKSWKLNLRYFEDILEDALTAEQMACFHEYVSSLDCSWISLSTHSPNSAIIGEPITHTLSIRTPDNNFAVQLCVKWMPPHTGNIQLLHPLKMIDPRQSGLELEVHGEAEIKLILRSVETGTCDFGRVSIYSTDGTFIATVDLAQVEIVQALYPFYYHAPNYSILQQLKQDITETGTAILPTAITGLGGIGKSTLIREAMITAAQFGYVTLDISQPKDLLHPRFALRRLLAEITSPNLPEKTPFRNTPWRIKTYLGNNYNPAWEGDIERYFQHAEHQVNLTSIIECCVSLLLTLSQTSPVFIWISNMHWASKETLDIIRSIVDELYENQKMLGAKIIWICEGRIGETLIYDGRAYFPADWGQFVANDRLRKLALQPWNLTECSMFLMQLLDINLDANSIYSDYAKRVQASTGGIPLFMLEMIRNHLEEGILKQDKSGKIQLCIDRTELDRICWSKTIEAAIVQRIFFYRNICSEYVDFCSILATLDDYVPAVLLEQMTAYMHTAYVNFDMLLLQSAFLSKRNDCYHFSHEKYQEVFRNWRVESRTLQSICLSYYDAHRQDSIYNAYAEIRLRLLWDDRDLAWAGKELLRLLQADPPIELEQSIYRTLLKEPQLLAVFDMHRYDVLFCLCESLIKAGSWKAAQIALEELLASPIGQNMEEVIIHIKGHQELSNILGDRLLFDQAIETAANGIELVESYLTDLQLSPSWEAMLYVEYAKLMARLAVCHWFSGNLATGISIQRQCYDLAVLRGDLYSAGHVLYEIGTLMFHYDLDIGLRIMEKVLEQCVAIPSLEKNERTLIETQQLIGVMMRAIERSDAFQLRRVRLRCRRLLEKKRFSENSYEEFLCLTMAGICAFWEKDTQKAHDYFIKSLRCAVESDMPNLEWKALLHIAQINALLLSGDPVSYATEAKKLIEEAIADNPQCRNALTAMFTPVLDRLNGLIEGTPISNLHNPVPQTMLSVFTQGCLFVVMN